MAAGQIGAWSLDPRMVPCNPHGLSPHVQDGPKFGSCGAKSIQLPVAYPDFRTLGLFAAMQHPALARTMWFPSLPPPTAGGPVMVALFARPSVQVGLRWRGVAGSAGVIVVELV